MGSISCRNEVSNSSKKMGLVCGNIFFADLKKIPTEACKPSGLEKKAYIVWFIWKMLKEWLCKQIYGLL
jgi:hypothetical protein